MKEIRYCEVCGVSSETKRVCFNKLSGMCLCEKHRDQFRRFGEFKDSSPRGVFDPNNIKIKDDIAEIDTYDQYGNVVETFILDSDCVPLLGDKKWRTVYKKDKPYLFTGNQKQERIYFHRLVLPAEKQVDHISGDTHDNRRRNLREVTIQENMMNLKKKKDNTSGIRGVSFNKKKNTWKTDFTINKTRVYLREYHEIEKAVYQRFLLETQLLKEFRNTSEDELYFEHINKLSLEEKKDIEEYIESKLNTSKDGVEKI